MNIDIDKHIWEGWTVSDFIIDLEPTLDLIMSSKSYIRIITVEDLKDWIKDNQPYYKKHIPEVLEYFKDRYGIK